MATQKPISTISYNSESFLREKLDELYKAHVICAYQYIKHVGEDGDKDHIHLRIEPNRRLDSMDLQEQLREWVQVQDKPLGVRPFRYSKEEDWYLYVVHDPDYLRLKYGVEGDKDGKIPYDYHDIQVSEFYDLDCAFLRARAYLKHSTANIVTRFRQGDDPVDMVAEGASPFMVSTITRLVAGTEFGDLARRYRELEQEYSKVMSAIEKARLVVVVDDAGRYFLEPTDVDVLPDIDEYVPVPFEDLPFNK